MSTQKPNQYVTLVSEWKAKGVSHTVEGSPSQSTIWAKCGRSYYYLDNTVMVTDAPGSKGVCKVCERKSK